MSATYLVHHGILGQKWGKKQGPPYPLDASDHSSAEKKEGSKGWTKEAKKNYKISSKEARNDYKDYFYSQEKILGVFRNADTGDKKLKEKAIKSATKASNDLITYELAKSREKGQYTKKYIDIQKRKKYDEVYDEVYDKLWDKPHGADRTHEKAKKASEEYAEKLQKVRLTVKDGEFTVKDVKNARKVIKQTGKNGENYNKAVKDARDKLKKIADEHSDSEFNKTFSDEKKAIQKALLMDAGYSKDAATKGAEWLSRNGWNLTFSDTYELHNI